ncbi:hypothetical protein GCM10022216_16640 [Sphingobacterium kyonggiense]|uniref:HEAT repeat protein n=2 Tax=Sphingobacterium kyonggiense TaxID=714075 RepID=A0ABP7YNT1_9SPHI
MDLSFYFKYYLLYLENKFMGYPIVIRLTVLIVMALICIYLFSLVRFVWINRRIRKKEKIKERLINRLDGRIHSILSNSDNLSEKHIQEKLSDVFSIIKSKRKDLITDLLIDISDELKKGNAHWNEENYKTLIYSLEIPMFWESELMSNSSNRRHEALRKLDDLGKGFTSSILMRSTNHKNKELRKQARAAVLKYDNIDPYKFLDDSFDQDFNALDEILIHRFLAEKSNNGRLPVLSRWVINAKNVNFKAFMIREIGKFKQTECSTFLVSLLQDELPPILKSAIIYSLGELNCFEQEERFIQMYPIANSEVQKSIIDALVNFNTQTGLDFLTKQFFKSTDNEQKVHLAYSIKKFGEQGRISLENLSARSNDFERKIFDQVKYQLS